MGFFFGRRMNIWIKHERHGVKCCYAESEALADIANGWVRADAVDAAQPAEDVFAAPSPTIPAVPNHYPAKRGRKPKGA